MAWPPRVGRAWIDYSVGKVAATALALMPSESAFGIAHLPAFAPSFTQMSGASRLLMSALFLISSTETAQSFGSASNRPRMVLPVELAAQPQSGGFARSVQSRVMI